MAMLPIAAVFDLTATPEYLTWHFIHISVPNLLVIVLMIVVFLAAILIPFPRHQRLP